VDAHVTVLFRFLGVFFFAMEGWIKLHRKFIDWEWYDISEMVHLFVHLLLKANHETINWRGIEVKRGQLITGLKQLHEETNISIQTLRSCLKKLEKTGEINRQTNNRFSLITIYNYDNYNRAIGEDNKQPNKQLTSNQQATNKQLTTNKNEKNEKNEKNNSVAKTPRFTPPSLDDVKKYCKERNNDVDAERWFDFYTAKNWMIGKNKMKDWKAAVRTWEKNDKNDDIEKVKKAFRSNQYRVI